MTKETITIILALWGAIVSSIAIGWNLFRDISQRGRLRVICYFGKIIDAIDGEDPNDYLFWNITNVGKEPLVLDTIGGALKEKHFLVNTKRPLPLPLKSGEYLLEYSSDITVFEKGLNALWAIDSIGKKYKVSKKQLKNLYKDFEEIKKKVNNPLQPTV